MNAGRPLHKPDSPPSLTCRLQTLLSCEFSRFLLAVRDLEGFGDDIDDDSRYLDYRCSERHDTRQPLIGPDIRCWCSAPTDFTMFAISKAEPDYDNLPTSEECSEAGLMDGTKRRSAPSSSGRSRPSRLGLIAVVVGAAVIGVLGSFALGYAAASGGLTRGEWNGTSGAAGAATPESELPPPTCKNLTYRREWRSFSVDEKKGYIAAFQCLIDSPSMMGLNGSLYNDLSWVHNLVAHSSELPLFSSR